nr:MAG TPA: regulatory protein [Caudoviricetes sp.]
MELQTKLLTIDSREVARMMEKRHDHLIRDVDTYCEYLAAPKIGVSEFWQTSSYKDTTGRKCKCYLITKKGCEFIAHKMTGKKGAIFTATYINRFHAMEEALKHPKQRWLPPQILRCKYFNSVPCMTLADLEFVAGFDHAAALWSLKRYYIPYIMLTKETLRQYRYENNLHTCNSRLIILTQASVVSLLKKTGRYTAEIIERVKQYFYSAAEPIREKRKVVPELAIRQLYILRNTLPYMTNKEERNLAAKYIVDRLMELDLLRPSDYPGENLYDTDINSVGGWNVDTRIQNAHYMLDKGMQVTRQSLFDFQDQLLAEARASIK